MASQRSTGHLAFIVSMRYDEAMDRNAAVTCLLTPPVAAATSYYPNAVETG